MTTEHRPAASSASDPRRAPRTRVLVAAAVLVGLLVGAGVLLLTVGGSDDPAAAPTTSSSTATAPTAPTTAPPTSGLAPPTLVTPTSGVEPAGPGALPDGCLGGADARAAVLAAHSAAPLDDLGAAAFALTFARWGATYPVDPALDQVLREVEAPDSFYAENAVAGAAEYARTLREAGFVEVTTVPDTAAYRVINSSYGVFAGAQLQVSFDTVATRTDGTQETVRRTTTLTLEGVDGRWAIVGSPPVQPIDPADVSTKPFQSYYESC